MTSFEQNKNRETAGKSSWNKKKTILIILLIVVALFAARTLKNGGNGGARQAMQPQAPSVVVYRVANADLAAKREYIGRVEPIQTVSIKPQVAGEIAQVNFKDGSHVKAGQLLFTIDNRQYQATVEARKADLEKAEANYDRAVKYHNRLKAADKRSISASDLELAESDVLQGRASVEQAKAALKLAQIDLGYTKITAPISGQIGKALYTKGNYVTPALSELATIVQIDPVRVTFSLPDKDYLNQIEAFKQAGNNVYDAEIKLANGETYPVVGTRDFEDNTMDSRTGTMMMSLRYKNDSGLLVPGSLVRITVKPSETHISPVIPQESVMADSQGDYVYVVDASNIVHRRSVSLGIEYGVMREVISGVKPDEVIVRRGLQSVRPEIEVSPAPIRDASTTTLEPSELAMESGYDLAPIPLESGDKQEQSAEGKN